ncbi:MAG TPA: GNAT family N-acetyltransferase, partial [Stellaceae bacterium]|nr:GNAT family N-acetyltransferase [Stellaceae bacterium]
MIRLARAEDLGWVADTIAAAFRAYIPRMGRAPAPITADHAAYIAAGEVHVFEAEGQRLGLIVQRAEADHLFVDILAVAPGAQHRGVGRALMGFAEDEARRLGLPALRLYTNAKMSEALRFYPALGFRQVAERREDGFDRVYFEKRL